MGVIRVTCYGTVTVATTEELDPSGVQEDLSTLVWDAIAAYGEPDDLSMLTIRVEEIEE